MTSSQDSLPSPERIPNLWRYGQSPSKLSGSHEDFSSAGEISGGQVEQEGGEGGLFSLRRQVEDESMSQTVGQSIRAADQESEVQEKGNFSAGEHTTW
jgi:hypothetical protein